MEKINKLKAKYCLALKKKEIAQERTKKYIDSELKKHDSTFDSADYSFILDAREAAERMFFFENINHEFIVLENELLKHIFKYLIDNTSGMYRDVCMSLEAACMDIGSEDIKQRVINDTLLSNEWITDIIRDSNELEAIQSVAANKKETMKKEVINKV